MAPADRIKAYMNGRGLASQQTSVRALVTLGVEICQVPQPGPIAGKLSDIGNGLRVALVAGALAILALLSLHAADRVG